MNTDRYNKPSRQSGHPAGWPRADGDDAPGHEGLMRSSYNFVAAGKKVYFPDDRWVNAVSHDLPFSDGLSGSLTVEVTARTPLYIRNGGNYARTREERGPADHAVHEDFYRLDASGPYAIPGSSLRGMLRSILEIATFAKLQQVQDRRFGFRDLQDQRYTDAMTASPVRAGWLATGNHGWQIIPCRWGTVTHQQLNRGHWSGKYLTTMQKYADWGDGYLSLRFAGLPAGEDGVEAKPVEDVANETEGPDIGTLVFTGQPGRGKKKEFVFHHERANEPLTVSDKVQDEFLFIHGSDSGDISAGATWKYWRNKGERVPVFYHIDDAGAVESMGLARMYRLPYKHTIHDAIRSISSDLLNADRRDFVEVLFGHVHGDQSSLKGRVMFAPLPAEGNPVPGGRRTLVLGQPRATFVPNYLRQQVDPSDPKKLATGHPYTTYQDSTPEGAPLAKIRGWKRYLPQPDGKDRAIDVIESKSSTAFRPLPAGTKFSGRLGFHNLRPAELGALVWALTWGGNSTLRHQLGLAKAHGYGSVSCRITAHEVSPVGKVPAKADPADYLVDFETLMDRWVGPAFGDNKKWRDTGPVRQLLAFADPNITPPHPTGYPILNPRENINEFRDIKRQRLVLPVYPKRLVKGAAPAPR